MRARRSNIDDESAGSTLSTQYALWLWVALGLFCLRVVAQLLVATLQVSFLPQMEEWFSGLVPYPSLLVFQLLIVGLCGTICVQFSLGRGWFVRPRSRLGSGLLAFGLLYLGIMIIRYVIRMYLYPVERWTGGSLPIFFHWVLASFLLIMGLYHRRADPARRSPTRRTRVATVAGATVVVAGMVAWVGYLVAPTALAHALGGDPPFFAVRTQRHVTMTTSDGIDLVADVYRPMRAERTPTLLVRIPYSKTVPNRLFSNFVGRMWAEHGYTVVIQGTRGRYESGGIYDPLVHERRDGIQTLRWLEAQPWFDGRLGMWGGSYFGYTQWVLADQTEPGPSALFIQIASSSFYDMFYPGGAFALESALYWALRSHGPHDRPVGVDEIERGLGRLPLVEADDRAREDVPFFNDWVRHPTRDAYWRSIDGEGRPAALQAPTLLLTGWFDPFLPGQLADFERIRAEAAPHVASNTHLIIGPWGHAETPSLPDGFQPRGYRAASLAPALPWFDRHLKGENTHSFPPVKLFTIGENVWREEQEWPLARTRYTPFFLSSGDERHVLSVEPGDADQATYRYDPADPVPTRGGAMLGTRAGMRKDDRASRPDILSFKTEPLDADLEVTGPIRAVLYVRTTAPNTDFTATLWDIHPGGSAYHVSEGILRRSYGDHAEPLDPVRIEIAMWPTSVLVRKGHALRLDISSSNYPRFDVNPNTGREIATETESVAADQTIFWGGDRRSQLVLPVIPR